MRRRRLQLPFRRTARLRRAPPHRATRVLVQIPVARLSALMRPTAPPNLLPLQQILLPRVHRRVGPACFRPDRACYPEVPPCPTPRPFLKLYLAGAHPNPPQRRSLILPTSGRFLATPSLHRRAARTRPSLPRQRTATNPCTRAGVPPI